MIGTARTMLLKIGFLTYKARNHYFNLYFSKVAELNDILRLKLRLGLVMEKGMVGQVGMKVS